MLQSTIEYHTAEHVGYWILDNTWKDFKNIRSLFIMKCCCCLKTIILFHCIWKESKLISTFVNFTSYLQHLFTSVSFQKCFYCVFFSKTQSTTQKVDLQNRPFLSSFSMSKCLPFQFPDLGTISLGVFAIGF